MDVKSVPDSYLCVLLWKYFLVDSSSYSNILVTRVMQICYNNLFVFVKQHINVTKFVAEFRCLTSTYVEASLQGLPNNHVKLCILKELLVMKV